MSFFQSLRRSSSRGLRVISFILLITGVVIIAGCGQDVPAISVSTTNVEPPNTVEPPAKTQITLALVGDIMMHADQLTGAYDSVSRTYKFDQFFVEVEPYLSSADLTVGNLETTLAGREAGFSGYPRFNSPGEIVSALQESGFDVLTCANNHSLDRNEQGVLKTIETLQAAGMAYTGTNASAEASSRIALLTRNGIKIAVLAYTYGTNGIPIPEGKAYLVNLLDLPKIEQDIAAARTAGADIVLVYPHLGIEYRRVPGEPEKKIIEEIFQAGADIVAASHPHVIQPMHRNGAAENGLGLFTAYSLGNFISGQRGQYKDSGVIVYLTIEKDLATGKISLLDAQYIPTWVHKYREKGKTVFRVLGVEKAIRDYTQGTDKKLAAYDYKRLQEVWQETTAHLKVNGGPIIRNI